MRELLEELLDVYSIETIENEAFPFPPQMHIALPPSRCSQPNRRLHKCSFITTKDTKYTLRHKFYNDETYFFKIIDNRI